MQKVLRYARLLESFFLDGPQAHDDDSHLFEEVKLRLAEAEQVGVGFDVTSSIAPNFQSSRKLK